MAAVAEQVALEPVEAVQSPAENADPDLFGRVRRVLAEYSLAGRVRKFLWLSSGLFSAASFAIPFIGFVAYGTGQSNSTNFLAAIVSACLFGVASLLRFGPDTA